MIFFKVKEKIYIKTIKKKKEKKNQRMARGKTRVAANRKK
jgi:hypothetical protein